MHPEPFDPDSRLRASDADREQAASVLASALAEGRLTVAEHAQRLDAVYAAKTHAEIAPLVQDLPARPPAPVVVPGTGLEPATTRRHRVIAIFGGATRRGPWRAEPRMTAVTVFGGASIDFREAALPQQELTMHCTSVFGGMDIVVPPDVHVIDSGVAVFGGRDIGPGGPDAADRGARVLRLTGLTLFGGLSVKYKERKARGEPRTP